MSVVITVGTHTKYHWIYFEFLSHTINYNSSHTHIEHWTCHYEVHLSPLTYSHKHPAKTQLLLLPHHQSNHTSSHTPCENCMQPRNNSSVWVCCSSHQQTDEGRVMATNHRRRKPHHRTVDIWSHSSCRAN